MPLSFALSITHFFSSVGADAGFAAIIGLAILILLYFAHARETSTLRNQLTAAMQRIDELERRLARGEATAVGAGQPIATGAVPTAPVAAPAGGQPPSVAPTVSPRPLSASPVVAPAGVAAPPLSDATRVVPVAEPPGDAGAVTGDGVGRTPPPVTAAAGGNGFSAARATGGAESPPRSLLEHGIPGQRRSLRWVIPVVAVLVIAGVAVALVLVLSSHPKTAADRHHGPKVASAPPSVAPSSVTVAVVNGTSINQLAHHVAKLLTKKGFKEGTLATATNQSHATTTVGYLPGQRNEALAVAHALKLPAGVVGPATHSSEALVCPNATTCTADVVVVAGPNLAPKR